MAVLGLCFQLTALSLLAQTSDPAITQAPQSQTVLSAGNAIFTVQAAGSDPISYQWMKNGTALVDGRNISGSTTNVLALSRLGAGDSGSYQVVITNAVGSVTSAVATLTVSSVLIIETRPGGQNTNYYYDSGFLDTSANATAPGCTGTIGARYSSGGSGAPQAGLFLTGLLAGNSYSLDYCGPTTSNCNTNQTQSISCTNCSGLPATTTVFRSGSANTWKNIGTFTAGGDSATIMFGLASGNISASLRWYSTAYRVQCMSITAPLITSQPASQMLVPGSDALFSVAAAGKAPLDYAWYFNGATLLQDGATPSVTLTNVAMNSSGNVTVVVSNDFGSVTSSVASLTVVPALIVSQPASQTAYPGSSVSFSVAVNGAGPLGYSWYFNNGTLLQSGPSPALTLNNVTTNNGGSYTVVVTNVYGSVTSGPATLALDVPPVIVTQPASQTVQGGSNASFSVGATGVGPLSYLWQFNGISLPNKLITTTAGNGSTNYSGDGGLAVNAGLDSPYDAKPDGVGNLYIADTFDQRVRKVDANGTITTVAGNGGSGAFSGDGGPATQASLYYPVGLAVDAAGDVFIADLINGRIRKVDAGGTITTVAGNGNAAYSGDGGWATNASLYYPSAVAVDAPGNLYICDYDNCRIRMVNTNGVIRTVAGNGKAKYAGDGGQATNASLQYPWGVAVDGSGNLYIADQYNSRVRKVGANGIITTVAGNGTNGYSGDGGPATGAKLNYPAGVAVDASGNLYISDGNNSRIRKVGTNGIITTVAGNGTAGYSGDGGAAASAELSYPNGVALDSVGNVYVADTGNCLVRKVAFGGLPTLTLNNVATTNTGSYSVVVANAYGSVTSSVASLTVPGIPPSITSQQHSMTVSGGDTAVFSVGISGAPPLTCQWQKNGTNLSNTASIGGATTSTLALCPALAGDAGSYWLVVTNAYGCVTSSVVTLTVLVSPPTISTQPQSVTLFDGNLAVFSVSSSGTPPLVFQWQKNGVNLTNDSRTTGSSADTLMFNPVTTNDAGSYTAIIRNDFGSVTSSVATLTVLPSRPKLLDGGIDPANLGKGEWVYILADAINGLSDSGYGPYAPSVTDIPSMMAFFKTNLQLQYIVVKAGNGAAPFPSVTPQFTTNLVQAAHDQGLKIFGYTLSYGADIPGELAIATNVFNAGADGFIFDAEDGFITQGIIPAQAAAWTLCGQVKTNWPTKLLGYSAYADIYYKFGSPAGFPYKEFGYWCDLVMPQTYWASWSKGSGSVAQHGSPVTGIQWTDTNYIQFHAWLAGQGMTPPTFKDPCGAFWTSAIKPLVQIGEADMPGMTNQTYASMTNFISYLKNDPTAANVGGYKGCCFFRPGLQDVGMLNGIAAVPIGEPMITTGPSNCTNNAGATACFTVSASGGAGLITYQWWKDGTALADGGNISGSATAALTVANIQSVDAGIYSVVVSNSCGSVTSPGATLTVAVVSPTISAQPQSLSLNQGQSALFDVTAGGSTPLFYQWRCNGTNLDGATASELSLPSIQFGDAGSYSVLVSNAGGTVTSSNALLNVLSPLFFTTTGGGLALTWSGPFILQSSTNVAGPYCDDTNSAGSCSPDTRADPQRFFRLRLSPDSAAP